MGFNVIQFVLMGTHIVFILETSLHRRHSSVWVCLLSILGYTLYSTSYHTSTTSVPWIICTYLPNYVGQLGGVSNRYRSLELFDRAEEVCPSVYCKGKLQGRLI